MNTRQTISLLTLAFLLHLVLTACAPSDEMLTGVTEAYLQAIADRDLDRLAQASCSAWEPHARIEAISFTGAAARTESLECSLTGMSGGAATVTCRGAIVATVASVDRYYPLGGRAYRLEQEEGLWRVCGSEPVAPEFWGAERTDNPLSPGG